MLKNSKPFRFILLLTLGTIWVTSLFFLGSAKSASALESKRESTDRDRSLDFPVGGVENHQWTSQATELNKNNQSNVGQWSERNSQSFPQKLKPSAKELSLYNSLQTYWQQQTGYQSAKSPEKILASDSEPSFKDGFQQMPQDVAENVPRARPSKVFLPHAAVALPIASQPGLSSLSQSTPAPQDLSSSLDSTRPVNSPLAPSSGEDPVQRAPGVPRNSNYLIAPRNLDLNVTNPNTTQIIINDILTSHHSNYEVNLGSDFGNRRNVTVGGGFTKLFKPQISESVSRDRIYRVEYNNIYSQIRSSRQVREITTSITEPQTLTGQRQQISFMGNCLNTATNESAKQLCTFTPGLITDKDSIDPKTLMPTRFINTSNFGDVVSPESLEEVKQPNFQSGVNGQLFGFDFYFPRVGSTPGNAQSNVSQVERNENVTNTPSITVGRVRQVVATNGEEAALARTIRGFTYVLNDRNSLITAGLQGATELLPNAEPSMAPGQSGRSTAINPALFLAANNTRIPDNSYTSYSVGWGSARTLRPNTVSPPANYNSLWIGLSPVTEHNVNSDVSYQPTGPQSMETFAGGEGGPENGVKVTSLLNGQSFATSAIPNAYSQVYLSIYKQDANRITTTRFREQTDYCPHISFTGNITTNDSVLRYYTGAIFNTGFASKKNNDIKAYVGMDYNKLNPQGFSYGISAIGYTNPDADYYNQISAGAAQQINLGPPEARRNLFLSAKVNYAMDEGTTINSYVNVGAALTLGSVSLEATYFIPTDLPNSVKNMLLTTASWQVTHGISLTGYYTPINENSTRSQIGFNTSINLGNEYNSPTLILSWSNNQIDFGLDPFGSPLGLTDNIFGIFVRFGEPLAPFASRLRR